MPLRACRNRYGTEEREVKGKAVEDESGTESEEEKEED